MTKQLELDVLALPTEEQLRLLHLLIDNLFAIDKKKGESSDDDSELDRDMWDKQIVADDRAGKLDFLFEEANLAKENNQLQTL